MSLVSGESLQFEADSVNVENNGTVTFSLSGEEVLFISPANYTFIMETAEPLDQESGEGE